MKAFLNEVLEDLQGCITELNNLSKRGWKEDDEDLAHHDSDDAGDDNVICDISNNWRVPVRNWQGKVVVDIREFYTKDGKTMPGKKRYVTVYGPVEDSVAACG